ncbi:hypothetical protein DSO57_1000660 [Entomophthora muscae]|uniref:Uncharacterized protein n=1 Tax=Entomophthora muscae TaxID=34485 RepID=A0ACC2TWY2_9FUNG|nr:hypothetical protein DSO57_1000660 [Entomophthora muscae]
MRLERRIVRGYDSKPFSHKFMVSIHYEDVHSCGGTLYKQDTVITAAHCSEEDIRLFDVLVHRHDFQKTDEEEHGSRYKIKEFITHPDYSLLGVKNDIAIVRLDRKGHIRTRVILDDAGISEMEGMELTLLGWGLNEHGEYPDILQETKLPILDIEYCKAQYATLGYRISEAMVFCAGFAKAQSDSCNADSGGPIFLVSSNHVVLVGVVSWGEGCAKDGFPGFYTRVSSYIPWILATV